MLREIFEDNNKIIINTDIDGFLSGMILKQYFNCEIVGFTNSKDKVWIVEEYDNIFEPVYIDMFINNPETVCIEQHILAYDNEHLREMNQLNRIGAYARKINPNLERGRNSFRGDYYHKYPFGTVHYLISLMEREGIQVQFPELERKKTYNLNGQQYEICLGQIILRADDAMYSSIGPYRENAISWWNWLNPDFRYESINRLIRYLNMCHGETEARRIKNETAQFFINGLNCDGGDGAFSEITDDLGRIQTRVLKYVEYINDLMESNIRIPEKYVIHQGRYGTTALNERNDISIGGQDVFSYAIIASPTGRYNQLSYTIDMC